MEHEFCNYFTKLFTTSKPSHDQMAAALIGISPRITEDMNELLEKPFIAEEVVEALNQMCPTKALGPDGLPAVFYQKHWHQVKEGVTTTCLHILNKQGTITDLNHTYIALVPKLGSLEKLQTLSLLAFVTLSIELWLSQLLIGLNKSCTK